MKANGLVWTQNDFKCASTTTTPSCACPAGFRIPTEAEVAAYCYLFPFIPDSLAPFENVQLFVIFNVICRIMALGATVVNSASGLKSVFSSLSSPFLFLLPPPSLLSVTTFRHGTKLPTRCMHRLMVQRPTHGSSKCGNMCRLAGASRTATLSSMSASSRPSASSRTTLPLILISYNLKLLR